MRLYRFRVDAWRRPYANDDVNVATKSGMSYPLVLSARPRAGSIL